MLIGQPPGLQVKYILDANASSIIPDGRFDSVNVWNWNSVKCVASSRTITSYACPWYWSTSFSLSQYPSFIRDPLGNMNSFVTSLYSARRSSLFLDSVFNTFWSGNKWFSLNSGRVRLKSKICIPLYLFANSMAFHLAAKLFPPNCYHIGSLSYVSIYLYIVQSTFSLSCRALLEELYLFILYSLRCWLTLRNLISYLGIAVISIYVFDILGFYRFCSVKRQFLKFTSRSTICNILCFTFHKLYLLRIELWNYQF